jgi:hypothetical protein
VGKPVKVFRQQAIFWLWFAGKMAFFDGGK